MSNSKELFQSLTTENPGSVGLKKILRGEQAEKQPAHPSFLPKMQMADMSGKKKSKELSEDAKAEIEALKKQLQVQAQEIKSLQSQQKDIRAKALAEGMARGQAEGIPLGKEEATQKYESLLIQLQDNMQQVLQGLEAEKQHWFQTLESQSGSLALTVLRKLFPVLAEQHEDLVQHSIQQAMELLGQSEKLTLRVNPADFPIADQSKSFWLPLQSDTEAVKLVEDERISRGGCFLETDSGNIDLRIETLFTQIESIVKSAYPNTPTTEE
jgi:flagellar assembly protein FliH